MQRRTRTHTHKQAHPHTHTHTHTPHVHTVQSVVDSRRSIRNKYNQGKPCEDQVVGICGARGPGPLSPAAKDNKHHQRSTFSPSLSHPPSLWCEPGEPIQSRPAAQCTQQQVHTPPNRPQNIPSVCTGLQRCQWDVHLGRKRRWKDG